MLKITGWLWPKGASWIMGDYQGCFTHRWDKPKPLERCLAAQGASLWLHITLLRSNADAAAGMTAGLQRGVARSCRG